MSSARLTLLSKPGCHLCDAAREVVASVTSAGEFAGSVEVEELSILDDPQLNDRYWDEIPVVLINGTVHNIWRVDSDRLTEALREATQ